jgi:hypothetical protein
MVTTPAPDEPTVESQPSEEATEVTEEATEETTEVDYKAKAAELESQVDKLQNDLRSKDGQRRRDTDRDAEFAGFRDELGAMRKVFSLYMDALQKGDTYEVQDQISAVNNVQIEAARMVAQEERRKATVERQQLADEAKNAGKKALERAGVADLDTGAAIAGGNEELRGSALIERGLRKRNL